MCIKNKQVNHLYAQKEKKKKNKNGNRGLRRTGNTVMAWYRQRSWGGAKITQVSLSSRDVRSPIRLNYGREVLEHDRGWATTARPFHQPQITECATLFKTKANHHNKYNTGTSFRLTFHSSIVACTWPYSQSVGKAAGPQSLTLGFAFINSLLRLSEEPLWLTLSLLARAFSCTSLNTVTYITISHFRPTHIRHTYWSTVCQVSKKSSLLQSNQ